MTSPPAPSTPATAPATRLARRLNTFDAVIIGLGAMIGAGVFVAVAPAARAAGSGLLVGLAIAAGVAYLNASSMAQLAAVHPESGGAYAYGRKRLGDFWGFLAGFCFITGKLASCAAMSMTFAHYAFPSSPRAAGIAAAVALTVVNTLGVQKTARMTRLIVALVIAALIVVVTASLAGGGADPARLHGVLEDVRTHGVTGTLQAAGLLFFAFAGYARIATLGEEVLDPARTIPRAIPIAFAITLVIYAVVMITALVCVGDAALAVSDAPLVAAVESGSFAALAPVVRAGAAVASLGVLLSLLAGIGRTSFAMASNGDLPRVLAAVHPTFKVPHRAELAAGAIVVVIVALWDVRGAIGFSSFGVLLYYAVANAAALRLSAAERRQPKLFSALGVVGCLVVAATLPLASALAGAAVVGSGALLYWLRRGLQRAITRG